MVRKHFETSSQGRINKGHLIKNGMRYYVRYMNHSDLAHSLELQRHVMDTLKKIGKPYYIIEKSKAFLSKLLDSGHAVVGTFVKSGDPKKEDRLAAHMLVIYPQNEQETGLADTGVLPDKDMNKISVVSNILVHQDFRGNRLMQQMLKEWLAIADDDGKSHAIAEICIDNEFSWSVFLDCGFVLYASGHDSRDGSDLVYAHKPLDGKFLYCSNPKNAASIKLFDDQGHLDKTAQKQLDDLLEKGFHALDYDRRTKTLFLERCIGIVPSNRLKETPPAPINDSRPH